MTEAALRELIRQVIAEILDQTPKPAKRRVLVLFTGALVGFDEALEQLRILKAHGWELEAVLTDSVPRVTDPARITDLGIPDITGRSMAAHDVLLVPTLTVNTAAKVAHGIGDSLATNVIAEFVMSARPVIAAVDAACPDSAGKRAWFPNLPDGYAQMLRTNLAALRSFGVTLCSTTDLAARALALDAPVRHEMVSEQTVAALAPGSVLRVGKKTLVTALARDLAAARGIKIEKQR